MFYYAFDYLHRIPVKAARVQSTHYVKLGLLIKDIDVFALKDWKEEQLVIKVYLGLNLN